MAEWVLGTPARAVLVIALSIFALVTAWEGSRLFRFYQDVSASRSSLVAVRSQLELQSLSRPAAEIVAAQVRLRQAGLRLERAQGFTRNDPLLKFLRPLPWLGKQAKGLQVLVKAASDSVGTGLSASDVALTYSQLERSSDRTVIVEALAFLRAEAAPMAEVEAGLRQLQAAHASLPSGLIGPLQRAGDDLGEALSTLESLVNGYNRAARLLPEMLGYDGPRRYLILPQNDTELFPSGGLISSYGIATFDKGQLVNIYLEYFGTLFDRWQQLSGGEYVEPPAALKNHLLRDYSWGLGEAGWYPDFPTTARLAADFTAKGGAPATDGVIAIDLQFVEALLELLGPVRIPDYAVTVTAANIQELTLELTRDEAYAPGQPRKAFLSFLSKALLNQVLGAPKQKWLPLLQLLDRMARERHLQVNFVDSELQAVAEQYELDGGILNPEGSDFLMLADTSVKSTKLNLILKTTAALDVALQADGSARYGLTYTVDNPFLTWKEGRDPALVDRLMLGGVYGSYLRLYTLERARIREVRLDGRNIGPEQVDIELGKRVFGRFFPVPPGAKSTVQFLYEAPSVAVSEGGRVYRHSLYVRKEAGTRALPLQVRFSLPDGARLLGVRLDGRPQQAPATATDLRQDREIEVRYSLPD